MNAKDLSRKLGLIAVMVAAVTLLVAQPAAASEKVQIKIKTCKSGTDSKSDCKMVVRDRAVAVCKDKKVDPDGGPDFCEGSVEFSIQNNKIHPTKQVVRVTLKSATEAYKCLGTSGFPVVQFDLKDGNANRKMTLDVLPACPFPQAWLYEVQVLTNSNTSDPDFEDEWAKDDPGVIIDR